MVGRGLLGPREVRELATRHGFTPSKALGQNFVVDPNTIRRIVRLAGVAPGDRVVEVGAGLGTLTLGLAAAAAEVVAIELDRRLLPALAEVLEDVSNVQVVAGDALSLEWGPLVAGGCRMVSNLPYNIATPLLARLLPEQPAIADFVVMVQSEVGARLVAPPGSRTYGSVSVLVAYHCDGQTLGRVPATVFWPAPRVESLLVRLRRRPAPVAVDVGELMRVVRAAFGQRRKTIRNSLAAGLGLPAGRVESALTHAGIDPASRAESLGLEEFARLVEGLR